MSKTTMIRVIKTGTTAKVFLPDGTQLFGILDAKVEIGSRDEIGKLTLVLCDFIIDSSLDKREEPDAASETPP